LTELVFRGGDVRKNPGEGQLGFHERKKGRREFTSRNSLGLWVGRERTILKKSWKLGCFRLSLQSSERSEVGRGRKQCP